ncbi:hypothetical protein [Prosthecobacter sp.]|uniref:hypothetical protein n=1 Tax=Prosthecobacter sp. TaxID=1965333 RepID=UPI003784C74D
METALHALPTADQIEEITKLIESANNVGDQAVAFSAARLKVCVDIGEHLNKWKKQLGHGKWEAFAEEHWPALTKHTRTRWQQLAIAKASGRLNLDDARTLRHAYVLAGILPDTSPADNTKSSAKHQSYVVHIARLVAALQHIDIKSLKPVERSTLAMRLQPVLDLHAQLTTDAVPGV